MTSGLKPKRGTWHRVADYRLTRRAALDLEGIATFTIERFGVEQARRYRDALKLCFTELAENPGLGRRAEHLTKGLRRFEYRAHIVFYLPEDRGVLIVRVLHSRMDVPRHL